MVCIDVCNALCNLRILRRNIFAKSLNCYLSTNLELILQETPKYSYLTRNIFLIDKLKR